MITFEFVFDLTPTSMQFYSLVSSDKAILALQEYSIASCHARNTIHHEATIETEAIANVGINAEIQTLNQKMKDTFSCGDRQYFAIPLNNLLRRSLCGRRRWLCLARLTTARAHERSDQGQQLLPTYFNIRYSETNPATTTDLPA